MEDKKYLLNSTREIKESCNLNTSLRKVHWRLVEYEKLFRKRKSLLRAANIKKWLNFAKTYVNMRWNRFEIALFDQTNRNLSQKIPKGVNGCGVSPQRDYSQNIFHTQSSMEGLWSRFAFHRQELEDWWASCWCIEGEPFEKRWGNVPE